MNDRAWIECRLPVWWPWYVWLPGEPGPSFKSTQSLGFAFWQSVGHASLYTSVCGEFQYERPVNYLFTDLFTIKSPLSSAFSSACHYRFLGLNTLTAYQRAKVSALKIVNLRMGGNRSGGNNQLIVTPLSSNNRETPINHARISTIQVWRLTHFYYFLERFVDWLSESMVWANFLW